MNFHFLIQINSHASGMFTNLRDFSHICDDQAMFLTHVMELLQRHSKDQFALRLYFTAFYTN